MSTTTTVVTTPSGALLGLRENGTILCHGIPYAQPPVGDFRLEPPRPYGSWKGVRDARTPTPGAVQPWRTDDPWNDWLNPTVQSLDCLTLRVHAPQAAVGAPVIVWIHGGGFISGVGTAPAHRGDTWARDGIVHVAINYRTGLDGFMLWPDADETATDNLGLRDQVAALQWVQDNIAAFGGDPGRVTVMGQSGGAVCAAMLMASPLAAGLFQQVVMQSGAPTGSFDPGTARERVAMIADLAGREPCRAAMRDLSEEETRAVLQAADDTAWGDPSLDPAHLPVAFTVAHGTPSLPEPVLSALAAGANSDVRLLIGVTADETAGMMAKLGLTDPANEALVPVIVEHLGVSEETLARYRELRGTTSALVALSGAASDATFGLPSRAMAATHQGASYLYTFEWQSTSLPEGMGADHTFDIPFVQDDFEPVLQTTVGREVFGDSPPRDLASEMHDAFVRFVRTGDPGWRPFDPAADTVKRFGAGERIMTAVSLPEVCA